MTSGDMQAAPSVRLRCDHTVDRATLDYARMKIDAVVGRRGLPAVTGEVRIVRAVAYSDLRWSATADLRVGGRQVVVVAEESTGHEVVDRLQDRLRRQTDRIAHERDDDGRRTAAPPWRGGDQRSA